ncbi:MAG: molybdenum cofactor guanylyltransferase MobA [Pseudomonadota bacterium]
MRAPYGVILAGGQARRFGGGDKGLLPLGGKPILSRVIERLSPQVAGLAINANGDPGRFSAFGQPVVADSVPDHPGPLAGILAGLDWAAGEDATHIVTVAADTPFFPPDLVPRLLLAAEEAGHPIALATTPDPERIVIRHPTFGLWPVALRDDLRATLAQDIRKVVLFADKHGAAEAQFPVEPFDPFFNVNTPADLETAQGMLAGRPA